MSCDESLQEVGSNTGINHFKDYEEYLNILESGLRRKKRDIMNVIKEWDERIFLNSDSSLADTKTKPADDAGLKRAMDLLDADSKEENTDDKLDHVLLSWISKFYHCCQYLSEILQRSRWESSVEIVFSSADISMKLWFIWSIL